MNFFCGHWTRAKQNNIQCKYWLNTGKHWPRNWEQLLYAPFHLLKLITPLEGSQASWWSLSLFSSCMVTDCENFLLLIKYACPIFLLFLDVNCLMFMNLEIILNSLLTYLFSKLSRCQIRAVISKGVNINAITGTFLQVIFFHLYFGNILWKYVGNKLNCLLQEHSLSFWVNPQSSSNLK